MSPRPAMRTPAVAMPGFPSAAGSASKQTPPDPEVKTPGSEEPAAPPDPRALEVGERDTERSQPEEPAPAPDAAAPKRPARPGTKRTRTERETASSTSSPALEVEVDLDDKYQAQFYGLKALKRHYERLVFELKQDGENTSLTELFNATLLHGPADPDQARKLIRELRATRT